MASILGRLVTTYELDQSSGDCQLCDLERRTARGGKDSIDHPPNGHNDLINAAAGALVLVASEPPAFVVSKNLLAKISGRPRI
jgi:hypothetical protein